MTWCRGSSDSQSPVPCFSAIGRNIGKCLSTTQRLSREKPLNPISSELLPCGFCGFDCHELRRRDLYTLVAKRPATKELQDQTLYLNVAAAALDWRYRACGDSIGHDRRLASSSVATKRSRWSKSRAAIMKVVARLTRSVDSFVVRSGSGTETGCLSERSSAKMD